MTVESDIIEKLQSQLNPVFLEVVNESHTHNVPPGSESHFKITIVCEDFEGKLPVARHRIINKILAEELTGTIHAMALHTMTPAEWNQTAAAPASPPCMGGGK